MVQEVTHFRDDLNIDVKVLRGFSVGFTQFIVEHSAFAYILKL
jgi:hypothetical protein